MSNQPLSSQGPILPLCINTANQLGLHEALVLAALNHLAVCQTQARMLIPWQQLQHLVGFLTRQQRDQALISLEQQGLITMYPQSDQQQLIVSFNASVDQPVAYQHTTKPITTQPQTTGSYRAVAATISQQSTAAESAASNATYTPPTATHAQSSARLKPLDNQWQPAADTLQRLEQHGIPTAFTWAQLDAFRLSGIEVGNNRNDWNTRFFRHVKSQWVYAQNDAQRFQRQAERTAFQPQQDDASPIQHLWQPSPDAMEILQRAGIDPQFIQDAVAEFVLYWSERGEAHKTWNSKFIQHIRQQWARFSAAVEHSTTPAMISTDWQPKTDCFDILAMGHIPETFARQLIPEFVLYWHDTKQVHNSWNSRYLQYVKRQWAQQLSSKPAQASTSHDQNATAHQSGYTTAAASIDRLSDTSWAD